MRTILGGIRALRRSPLAVVPLAAEGLVGGLLVGFGAFPLGAASAPATAVFPLDVFFDLKQSLAFASGWSWVVAALLLGLLVRAYVLASTLWLGDGATGPFVDVWVRVLRLTAIAAATLFPSAALFFIGVATRYAPFIWIAGVIGLVPAAVIVRRAARLDGGRGAPRGRGVPEVPAFIAYAYVLSAAGAAMSVLAGSSSWAAAAFVVCLGPLHALFFLGWREHLRNETYPGGGTLATAVTFVALSMLAASALYDRYIRDPTPVARVSTIGSLLLMGGADSTSTTGALSDIDPRDFGFSRTRAELLSYRGSGTRYTIADTRDDLSEIARVMSAQIAEAEPPRFVLGHSQASLIVDEILAADLTTPDRSVVLAPSPSRPPTIDIPAPDQAGPGKPGGDIARAVARLFDVVGLTPFDVDAPASPTNIRPVEVGERLTRLAIWALGDSVWLDGDWRRPGEINVVTLTDHVGVTNNARGFEAARDFFAGKNVDGDETSWRGFLVSVFRYAFEPWRPR